ncbi:uncharacterized protein LOC143545824 [Bidens hawaiensis]|uniref:uncharacterized protein LOC143545824 n=1 Tax=Bidens hawaiensis TaxID=980011 RepID=UPI0040492E0B
MSQTASTTIDNQDIKKDNLIAADKLSSPKETVAQEPHQTTTSDANTNDNTSTPKFEATTNDTTKASSTSSNENNSSPPVVQTTTTSETSTNQAPEISTNDSDAGKKATAISNHESQNAPTTQIPDSDSSNKQANHESQKSSTTSVPTSNQDANSVEQTNPPTDDRDDKKATNDTTQTASNELDTNKDDHGNQIPDSNTNNQANANANATDHGSPKSSTTTNATSNQDSNTVDQTNQPTADSDTKQATDQSTHTASTDQQTDKHENLMPTDESSTSQITNSDASKQANTDESPKTSTTKVPNSNQDPNSVDQTDPLTTTDCGTKPDTKESAQNASNDSEPEKKTPSGETGSNEDRMHLQNLIDQELKIVQRIYPKLGEHEKKIKEDAKIASDRFKKLKTEMCDLRELKDLKKMVTKLKLQIPARYMSYDENDKQKDQQSDAGNRDNIPIWLQKKMPRLHDKLFNESPICKDIHLRFNNLRRELKLCLLCFSVFPEKEIISRRSMIYWWIGEGLIPITQEYGVEECANRFFEELMDNGFIEPVSRSYGRYVPTCKMNPMVHAALVMIADKVNFFDFDKYGNPKNLGKFDEIESPEDLPLVHPLGEPREFFDFYNKKRELIISETINFVDLNGNLCEFAALPQDPGADPVKRDGKPFVEGRKHYLYRKRKITTKSHKVCLVGSGLSKGIPWENLHMLFNVNDIILEFKTEWFLRMKNINILFIGRWHSSAAHHIEIDQEFEFEKSLDQMNHVRFFCLKGVSSIPKLPDSISKLKSLVILDLRACHDLETIPETIGSLKCLTHMDMSDCYLLKNIPKQISFLESLQVLKGFIVVESTEKGICTLQDLKKLEHLRKLSMRTNIKKFPEESHLEALDKLEALQKLTILWGGDESKPQENTPKKGDGDESKPQINTLIQDAGDKPKHQASTPNQDAGDKPKLQASTPNQDVGDKPKPQTSALKQDVGDKPKLQTSTSKQDAGHKSKLQTSRSKQDAADKPKPQTSTSKQDAADKPKPQTSTSKQDAADKPKPQTSTSKQDVGDQPKPQTSTSKQDDGDKPKPQTNTSNEDAGKKKISLASKFKRLVQKKKWVEGSMRRMDAFNTSSLGSRLEKLDLKCFPRRERDAPNWVTASKFKGLKKLYIRGGNFSDLGQYDQILEPDESQPPETWNVEILRLKYLDELNMEWRELQTLFPKLKSLEKVKCPRLTLFPCNEQGIWMKKGFSTTT